MRVEVLVERLKSRARRGGRSLQADDQPWMNQPYSLSLTLPPLGAVFLGPLPVIAEP